MAKVKTIYSTKAIFTRLLRDAEKEDFLIPTYQRGYKWTSEGENSQIQTLLNDLYSAFQISIDRYYLQFITLKDNGTSFEVIDGQQRLTTLTILFSVFFHECEELDEDNFIKDKLVYQTRKNFIEEFIYNNVEHLISHNEWNDFIKNYPSHDNQDVFYIFHATKAISNFLKNIPRDENIAFFNYIIDKVQLIVNILDIEMNSEKIFINVNKGVKLKDADLVKGLLITKIPLDNKIENYRLTENEINEIRSTLGKQWDEIVYWANRIDITSFYKQSSTYNIGWVIKLAFPYIDTTNSDIPIFATLSKEYQNGEKATNIFEKIYATKLILDDWFNIPEIHNLLGFLLHSKSGYSLSRIWNELKKLDNKKDVIGKLKELVRKEIPYDEKDAKLKELNFHDSKDALFNLFLALDVVKYLPISDNEDFYNFKLISDGRWSIEHIFPQNPEDLKNIALFSEQDLQILKDLLPESIDISLDVEDENERKKITDLLKKIKNSQGKCVILQEEREPLAYLLSNNANELHRIGNLSLIELGINSSLSNNYFDKKRKIIVQKISDGKFVPFHTYDVFSKLILDSQTNLHVWSKKDIEEHEEYITNKVKALFVYLNENN